MTNKPISDHIQFTRDMEAAGLKVFEYAGRNFWKGPAVDVDNIQEALSRTKVQCQSDNLGKGYVVYPKAFHSTTILERF